ncbi:MAG: hypothetical protein SO253_04025 [Bacilli bacterium]|nr:hypothetical protein [Bacilli bacterium]
MKVVYAIIVLVVLITVFIVTFLLNKKVERPDGCEELNEHCVHCNITSCLNNKKEVK